MNIVMSRDITKVDGQRRLTGPMPTGMWTRTTKRKDSPSICNVCHGSRVQACNQQNCKPIADSHTHGQNDMCQIRQISGKKREKKVENGLYIIIIIISNELLWTQMDP